MDDGLRGAHGLVSRRVLTLGLAEGEELRDTDFEECRFERLSLEKARLSGVSFEECTFVGVDLSMCALLDVRFAECEMRESKALGVSWLGARGGGLVTSSLRVVDSRLDYSSFAGADVRGMSFERCSMREVDFTGADCRGVVLRDCDLSGARLVGTDLREASLVGSAGWAMEVASCRLAGLELDATTALDVVAALGITVVAG